MKQHFVFPEGFLWGGALWASGSEGARHIDGKAPDVWDDWSEKHPEVFFEGITTSNTIDFYHRHKEYVSLLKKMNMNSFRFSIAWSRFMPNSDGIVNPKALEYYQSLIDELKKNKIKPILCLWHFDLPQAMQDIGGWTNRKVCDFFLIYAKAALEAFASQVEYIMVHNEVGVNPQMGYLLGLQPPAIKNDFKKACAAGYHLLLAQAKTIEFYREKEYPGEIGTILNPNPVYPKSNLAEDVKAANFVDLIRERFYLDVSVLGEIPEDFLTFTNKYNLTPDIFPEDIELFKNNTVDLLGVNYYQPCRVQAPLEAYNSNLPLTPEAFYSPYTIPNQRMNISRGWEIYPKGIYDTMMRIKNEYGNIKCYIGENGMGVEGEEAYINEEGQIQDDYRIEFYEEHLYWLHKAIEEGANCIGYHVWSPFDNWSPVNTFKNRYGFYRFDCNNKTMTIKKSGIWFTTVCIQNGIELPNSKVLDIKKSQ